MTKISRIVGQNETRLNSNFSKLTCINLVRAIRQTEAKVLRHDPRPNPKMAFWTKSAPLGQSLACRHRQREWQTGGQTRTQTLKYTQTRWGQTNGETSHISAHGSPSPPPPPSGLWSWMIFDESRTCWSRHPSGGIVRPERHLCSVWQASCVIYDLVMRDGGGQLDKGYSSKWDRRDSYWHGKTRV